MPCLCRTRSNACQSVNQNVVTIDLDVLSATQCRAVNGICRSGEGEVNLESTLGASLCCQVGSGCRSGWLGTLLDRQLVNEEVELVGIRDSVYSDVIDTISRNGEFTFVIVKITCGYFCCRDYSLCETSHCSLLSYEHLKSLWEILAALSTYGNHVTLACLKSERSRDEIVVGCVSAAVTIVCAVTCTPLPCVAVSIVVDDRECRNDVACKVECVWYGENSRQEYCDFLALLAYARSTVRNNLILVVADGQVGSNVIASMC